MTRYSEEIKVLRRADGGRNGPFEEAAKCIIFLDWQNSKFEERLSWFKGIETPTDIARKKQSGDARHVLRKWTGR